MFNGSNETMKKILIRMLAAIGTVAICGIAFIAWAMFAPPVPTSRFEKIELGMTKEQVRDILGEPLNASKADDGSEWWVYARMTWSLLDVKFSPEGKLIECEVDR
jgi:outer membrane protein assembly factor BamE (lipoprotein component of BamABCDE complex)